MNIVHTNECNEQFYTDSFNINFFLRMALRYGSFMIGLTSSVSAQMINSIFRHKLKLRSAGRFISSFGLMVASGGMALIGHELVC